MATSPKTAGRLALVHGHHCSRAASLAPKPHSSLTGLKGSVTAALATSPLPTSSAGNTEPSGGHRELKGSLQKSFIVPALPEIKRYCEITSCRDSGEKHQRAWGPQLGHNKPGLLLRAPLSRSIPGQRHLKNDLSYSDDCQDSSENQLIHYL